MPDRKPSHVRARTFPLLCLLLFFIGCSGGGGCDGGCGGCGLEPIPGGFPDEARIDGAIQTRLTSHAITFIKENLEPIIAEFVGGSLSFPIDETEVAGQPVCPGGCTVSLDIKDIRIEPTPPNIVRVILTIDLTSDPLFTSPCEVALDIRNREIPVDVELFVSPETNELEFKPVLLDLRLSIEDFSVDGGFLCQAADFLADLLSPLIDPLINLVSGPLTDIVNGLVEDFLDEARHIDCSEGQPCPSDSACSPDEICVDGAGEPVLSPVGLEGQINLGALLPTARGVTHPMGLYIVPGGFADVDGDPDVSKRGVNLGVLGGFDGEQSSCVPQRFPPPVSPPPQRLPFGNEMTPYGAEPGDPPVPFMFGLGIADRFLDTAFWGIYNSGSLCLALGADVIGEFLTTDTLGLLLQSLTSLTEGESRPVLLVLRPESPPDVDIGKGITEPDPDPELPPVIVDPLLTLNMTNLNIDFYTPVDDRMARIFTLTLDLHLGLDLAVGEDNTVEPVIGDITNGITNFRVSNDELVGEDPDQLRNIFPTLLGVALPLLTGNLLSFELPELSGFRIVFKEMQGELPEGPGASTHEFLALYADLEFPAAGVALTYEPETTAHLIEKHLRPDAHEGKDFRPWVRVAVNDEGGTLEHQWRVGNGGFWTPFQSGSVLKINSPNLRWPGEHQIQIRSRLKSDARAIDRSPAIVPVTVDRWKPRLHARYDARYGELVIDAEDELTVPDALRLRVRMADGRWRELEPGVRRLAVKAELVPMRLEVRAADEAGNEASAEVQVSQAIHGRDNLGGSGGSSCDCRSSAPSGDLALFALLGLCLLGVRRRR